MYILFKKGQPGARSFRHVGSEERVYYTQPYHTLQETVSNTGTHDL